MDVLIMAHEEWLELAEFYALSALDGNEQGQFESHLSAGCSLCESHIEKTAAALAIMPRAVKPLTPDPLLKRRLFDQIETEKPHYVFTLAEEGDWQEIAPGVTAKILYVDSPRQRITALCRMAPGSRYGDHRHTQTEELLILEGSCYCGGRLLREGDYHRAEPGSIHLDTRTDEGSLMLVITAMQNELLA